MSSLYLPSQEIGYSLKRSWGYRDLTIGIGHIKIDDGMECALFIAKKCGFVKPGVYVIPLYSAHLYIDPKYCAQQAPVIAEHIGMDTGKASCVSIISAIIEHLEDLTRAPPYVERNRSGNQIGEITATVGGQSITHGVIQ